MSKCKEGDPLSAIVAIEKIMYPKTEWAPGIWTIFSCKVVETKEGEPYAEKIVVKGTPYSLNLGGLYFFQGIYHNEKKYGEAYQLKQLIEQFEFSNLYQQELFLSTLTSSGNAHAICESFPDPHIILEKGDIQALSSVKGIGQKRAKRILQLYQEKKETAKAFIALSQYGISFASIAALLRRFDNQADRLVAVFEANPYALIQEASGIGWATADKIARKKGIPPDDPLRMKAAIEYQLNTYAQEGHTWVAPGLLFENTFAFLGLTLQALPAFKECLYDLKESGTLWWDENKTQIALFRLYSLEKNIARELKRLSSCNKAGEYPKEEYAYQLKMLEQKQGWEFSAEQLEAIDRTINSNVSIITGSAGVGKSSVVKGVLSALGEQSFAQCALSGRAAARLSEVTGSPGSTIHRLLGWVPGKGFVYNTNHPLPQNIIILDEVSMVGADIFYRLLQAIPTGGKLIMLGDPGQLESIGLCNVFKDMIDSGKIPVSNLTKIHRQAAKSAIVTESQKLRQGKPIIDYGFVGIEIRGALRDLKLHVYSDSILSQDTIMDEFTSLLEEGINPKDIQVVVPMRQRGEISVKVLNQLLQSRVNPPAYGKKEIALPSSGYILREGDRILITQNLYNAEKYSQENEDPETLAVFNGDCGYIVRVEADKILIDFPQYGLIALGKENYSYIELAYAMTCHKLQGSEAPYVIVGLDHSSHILLTREWLYTAITRAKKRCIICGETQSISYASCTSNVSVKQTLLKSLILSEFSKE